MSPFKWGAIIPGIGKRGDLVNWIKNDVAPHTVTDNEGRWPATSVLAANSAYGGQSRLNILAEWVKLWLVSAEKWPVLREEWLGLESIYSRTMWSQYLAVLGESSLVSYVGASVCWILMEQMKCNWSNYVCVLGWMDGGIDNIAICVDRWEHACVYDSRVRGLTTKRRAR